jgi:calcineurin-like phosphoesterase family protein
VNDEGETKLPTRARFVKHLRSVHAERRPKWDLSACIAGTQPGFTGRVWVWSDLHFFHENVIVYCNRPFVDAEAMNYAMFTNCMARVTADDILIFGGDITMSKIDVVNDMLRAIPAYKINVLGNHDTDKSRRLKLAVDETVACLELEVEGKTVFVSHYPVRDDALEEVDFNLHGHTHTTELHDSMGDGRRHINMSVEHLKYAPVLLTELLAQHQANCAIADFNEMESFSDFAE